MQISPELKQFIQEHLTDNTDKLLLAASCFPEIDLPFAVDQIIARRQIQHKLPSWYTNEDLIYPSRLSTEQCSSEQTAIYKQGLIKGKTVCDLTGGLGIDTYYLSQKATKITYIERSPEYCSAARHNFEILHADNILILNADARDSLQHIKADTFYIDPARRADSNKRVFALVDCEPDILQLKPILLDQTQRVIVKISPMADVEETLRLLPETQEVHILSVKNECKELLFILENNKGPLNTGKIKIHAINLHPTLPSQEFIFQLEEEKTALLKTIGTVQKYLYEPHVALLKSGAFKLTALRFEIYKLHLHSHLYTSNTFCPNFPGRIFIVDEVIPFSGKQLKKISQSIPQANVTTRNFPLSVAEFRKRSGIKEGGDLYLFATTLANEQKVILKTHKFTDTINLSL